MNDPKISILLPTYNSARFLAEAVDSVLAQTFQDFELIVIDDGSEDETDLIMEKYLRRSQARPEILYLRVPHGGVSAARNVGLRIARGEYICFLDADDQYEATKLQKEFDYLESHPESQAVFAQMKNYTDLADGELTELQKQVFAFEGTFSFIITAMYRKSLFDAVGPFQVDPKYDWASDTEWNFRAKHMGYVMNELIDEVLYFRRVHDTNISLSHTNTKIERLRFVASAIRNRRKAPAPPPDLSVIMPVYNSMEYPAQAAASLLAQENSPFGRVELILSDDGSTDETFRVLKEWAAANQSPETLIYLIRNRHGGPAAARNSALRLAAGNYIMFLDSDDILEKDALCELAKPFDAEPKPDAAAAYARDFRSPEIDPAEALSVRAEKYKGYLSGAVLFSSAAVRGTGYFDEAASPGEVVEWQVRFRTRGYQTVQIEAVTSRRRIHLNNLGRTQRQQEFSSYAAILRKRMRERNARSAESPEKI